MNKQEILEKSRKENEISDERTKYIELKGAYFAISILTILWIALSRLTPLDTSAKSALGLLATASNFSNCMFQLVHTRTKTLIFFTILLLIATIGYAILFLKCVYHLF